MYVCRGIVNTGSISSIVMPEICCEVFMPISIKDKEVRVEFFYKGVGDLRYYSRRIKGKRYECDLLEVSYNCKYNNPVRLEDNTIVISELFKKQLYKDMSILFVKAVHTLTPKYTTIKCSDIDALKHKLRFELKDLDLKNIERYIREPYRKVN